MRYCLHQELKLWRAQPKLAFVHLMGAPCEHLDSFLAVKDASRPASKCFYHQVLVEGIEKHHYSDVGGRYLQIANELKPPARFPLQLLTDNRDVRLKSLSNDEGRVGIS